MFLFEENIQKSSIRTLIGAILIKLATGIIPTFGNTGIYYLSYLKNIGGTIDQNSNALILLISIVPMTIITIAATKISNKFGYINTIKFCSFIYIISPLLLFHVQVNIYSLAFLLILIPGCAFGISAIPLLNIVWNHFPTHKHKVTSIVILFFSLSGIIWNYVFMILINPQNLPADSAYEGRMYFSTAVTDNVEYATNFVFIIAGSCFISGTLLLTQKMPEYDSVSSQLQQTSNSQKQGLIQLIVTKNFICIFISSLMLSMYYTYLNTNFKIIFIPLINDDHFLTYLSILYSIAAMAGTLMWGYIGDKRGIRFTVLLITSLDCFTKLLIYFVSNKVTFTLYYMALGLIDKGMVTVVGPGLVQLYGIQGGTQLLPVKATSVILTYAIIPVAQLLTAYSFTPLQFLHILALFNLFSLISSWILYRSKAE